MPHAVNAAPRNGVMALVRRIAGRIGTRTTARIDRRGSATGRLIALETGSGEPVWSPRDYGAFAREGMMQNAIVYRCVRMIAENAAAVPLLAYDGNEEIEDHPLQALLARPSPAANGADLLESFYGFLLVSGNAYLEAVGYGGSLRELHPLRPDRIKVVPGADGWPVAWEYSAGGETVRIAGEVADGVPRILHLKLFHPANDHYGLSPIEAAATAIDIHNAASRWNKALLDNSARPSGALVYGGGQHLAPDQFMRLKEELSNAFQGARNAGRPMLLEGGLDWKAMSLSPRDMDFIDAKHAAAREIALALGVPPMLLGIPGDNTYANYAEANRAFWRQTVLPLVQRTSSALSRWLSPAWKSRVRLVPDLDQIDALSPEREALWNRLEKSSFLTNDEKRAAVGYAAKGEVEEESGEPAVLKYNPYHDDQGRFTHGPGGPRSREGQQVAQGRTRFPRLPMPPPRATPPAKPMPVPPGKTLRNQALAGKKHPKTDIPFDDQGFPEFSSVARSTVKVDHTGVSRVDAATANVKAGFKETPAGWTWHHHQDGRTMQLVPRHIHRMTAHTGSIGIGNLPGRKMEMKSVLLELAEGFAQVSGDEIAAFEKSSGTTLPEAYKRFLLASNGGRPMRSVFPIDGLALNPDGAVHFFFGLNTGEENYDLGEIYDWFHQSIPEGIVPIACDDGSNYVCLDLRGGGERVAYWENSHHWSTGEWREEDLYHVANSFTEFLASLRPNVFPDNDP